MPSGPSRPAERRTDITFVEVPRSAVPRTDATPEMTVRSPRTLRRVAALGVLAVVAVFGYAGFRGWRGESPVRDPRYLEFEASPDHDAIDSKGVPLVQRYVLELYSRDVSQPEQQIDLGKPSPRADRVIHVDLSSIPIPAMAPGATYEAAIAAVGPYGSGDSSRSNRFTLSGR